MHSFWRRFGSLAFLCIPEDGGGFAGSGAAVADPVYQVPTGVGAGDGADRQDGNNGAPTSGAANSNSGGEPAAAASHDGAAAQTPNPNAPKTPAGQGGQPGQLPAGRSEEQNGRRQADELNTLRQTVKEQGELFGKLKAIFSPAAQGDPRLERIRNGILEAVPELKALMALKPEELSKALSQIPALQRQHDTHWVTVAERTMADIHKAIMPYVLGPEGKIDQFTEDQKEELAVSFRNWCLRDTTGARVRRYENGDPKLTEDFRDYYATTHHAPAHRANAAAAAARAAAGHGAPKAGKADVTGTPVPKVDSADEDAVHGAGWKHVSNALRSS